MTKPVLREMPFTDDGQTCARCGADKAEVRKYRTPCVVYGHTYDRHIWKWSMDDDHDSD